MIRDGGLWALGVYQGKEGMPLQGAPVPGDIPTRPRPGREFRPSRLQRRFPVIPGLYAVAKCPLLG